MLKNLFLLCAVLSPWVILAQEQDCICFEEIPALNGTRSPTKFATPNDGSGKKYVAEQLGIIWILDANDNKLPSPFLDLSDTILSGGERGFLSMAFHPDYASNGQLYLYYSVNIAGDEYTRFSGIERLATNPDVVDYNTERELMLFAQPFANHNGGDMVFGTDGYLYLSVGDGGASGDPDDNSQNLGTYLGNMLRIETVPSQDFYNVPADNPFLNDSQVLSEIYAYGLRNPWRISMDTGDRDTGDGRGRIWIADVGQNEWEEVDILVKGANFGWAGFEAMSCYKPTLCSSITNHEEPVGWYDHSVGWSITGGHVYRGCKYPEFNGWYFFGDYGSQAFFRMIESSPDVWEFKEVVPCSTACTGGKINEVGTYIQTFGIDQDGEVYVMTSDTYSTRIPNGRGFRIVSSNAEQPCS